MMKKINFDNFILLVSNDVRDVFRYYNVTEMHGLSHEGATKRINEGGTYCDGWTNLAPHEGMKPFLFLNLKTMIEAPIWKTATLIMHETGHLAVTLWELNGGIENDAVTPACEIEEKIITHAETLANEIMKKLKFPEIHFNLQF